MNIHMKWSAFNSGKVNTTKKIAKMVEADDRKEEHRSQVRTHTPEDTKKIVQVIEAKLKEKNK